LLIKEYTVLPLAVWQSASAATAWKWHSAWHCASASGSAAGAAARQP